LREHNHGPWDPVVINQKVVVLHPIYFHLSVKQFMWWWSQLIKLFVELNLIEFSSIETCLLVEESDRWSY